MPKAKQPLKIEDMHPHTIGAVLKDEVFTLPEPGSAESRYHLEQVDRALRLHRAKLAQQEKPK